MPAGSSGFQAHPWTFVLLPVAVAPLALAVVLLVRWWRSVERPALGPVVQVGLAVGTGILALGFLRALAQPFAVGADAERDWTAALVFARGIEFPLAGPAIYGGRACLGPQYNLFLGLVALVTEAPAALLVLPFLAQLLTLWIGASFARRTAGVAAALVFIVLWSTHPFGIQAQGRISHDYLAFPLLAAALWVAADVARRRDARWPPLAALLVGIAVQFYAVCVLFLPVLAGLAMVGRVRVGPREFWKSASLFLLPQVFTLGLAVADLLGDANLSGYAGGGSGGGGQTLAGFGAEVGSVVAGAWPRSVAATGFLALALGVSLWRAVRSGRGDDGAATARRATWLAVLLPFAALLAVFPRYQFRFGMVLLPAATLLEATAFTEFVRLARAGRPWGGQWLRGAALVVGLLLLGHAVAGDPPWVFDEAPDAGPALASLVDSRTVAIEGLGNVHGFEPVPFLHLVESGGMPVLAPGRHLWLTRELPARLEPDATFRDLTVGPAAGAVVEYRSWLDRANLRARGSEERAVTLPLRPVEWQRWALLLLQATDPSAVATAVRDPALGTHLRLEIPVLRALTRPVVIVVNGPCVVEAARGTMTAPAPVPCTTDPEGGALLWCTVASTGSTEPLVIDVDTASCGLHFLDVFDLPVAG